MRAADVVVTMGCGDTWFGQAGEVWPDEVRQLLASLGVPAAAAG